MTFITLKENEGAGIGHNSCHIMYIIWIVYNKSNLKYLHTNLIGKSKYYDIIFQYHKTFENNKVNYENLNKINITNINDFDLDDDNTLLIADEEILRLYFKEKTLKQVYKSEINGILINNLNNIQSFLNNDIDYDINSINITLHIRRGDIMLNDKYLNIFKLRYLPNSYYIDVLNKIKNLNLGKLKINLVSDGLLSEFEKDFKNFDINYILGTDNNDNDEIKRKTVSYLIFNDILITSPSGLSDISSIYSTGLVIPITIDGKLRNQYNIESKEIHIDNMNRDDILNKMKKA